MQQQLIKISKIVENRGQVEGLPANPRQINKEKYALLKKSIEQDPDMLELRELLVYPFDKKFIVIGGNMRLKVLRELGVTEAPCKVIPADTPVEKLRAYTIKDNNSFGEYDTDMLANDWNEAELIEWGCDLPEFDAVEEAKEAVEDDYSEEDAQNAENIVKRGEIWQLGEHRLMCGDSTCGGDVALLMNGDLAELVVTDPPYNVAIGSKNKLLNKMQRNSNRITIDIEGDKGMTDEEIGEKIWAPAFKNLCDFAVDDCAIYVSMPQGGSHMMMMMMMMMSRFWQVKHELIWMKSAPTFSMGRLNYEYRHEPIVYGWKKTHKWFATETKQSVLCFERPKKCDLHPTMKPIGLWSEFIVNSSQEGMIVADFFGGSGTTLIACEQLNRKCYMMELDEHYCDVIIDRWQKLTGKTAVKIEQQ